ncbi:MAG: sigma-70 family RNA polymerase sigma factor [Terriglobia bacterium]
MPDPPGDITLLLTELQVGNRAAESKLVPLVYDELRRLARRYMRGERADHTLQPTALVHEAYLRLLGQRDVQWQNRAHFFGVAAQLMRRILVDHARAHRAEKRGGDEPKVTLDTVFVFTEAKGADLVAVDEALTRLTERDPRQGRIVELRFFGGLTEEEAAEVLGVSTRTVKRDWKVARAWLYKEVVRGAVG